MFRITQQFRNDSLIDQMRRGNENISASGFLATLAAIGDPTQAQQAWAKRFCDLYVNLGLIDGDRAVPLCDGCRHGACCWDGLPVDARPPLDQAGVSIPWIGSRYDETGICVLGINQNSYGGLGAHWWIRRGDMEERLAEGKRGPFYYGASCYVAAARASVLRSVLPREIPGPREVADAWLSSSFLETIKCSPRGGRSKPSASMWSNCASTYLGLELELLAPSALIVIGRSRAQDQLAGLLELESIESRPRFQRWRGRLAGREFDVLACGHTSWPHHWRGTWPEMIDSLERRPLQRDI